MKGKERQIKDFYYFYFDRELQDRVTVCVLLNQDTGDTARGISVCSKDDEFNREEGKRMAKIMALKALKGRRLEYFINKTVIKILLECECPWVDKCKFCPTLSFHEMKGLKIKNYMDQAIGENLALREEEKESYNDMIDSNNTLNIFKKHFDELSFKKYFQGLPKADFYTG